MLLSGIDSDGFSQYSYVVVAVRTMSTPDVTMPSVTTTPSTTPVDQSVFVAVTVYVPAYISEMLYSPALFV